MSSDSSVATVAAAIRDEAGRRPAGDRLPSTREFVRRLGVSPVTVSRALAALVAEGIVLTRPGEGSFVAQRPVRVDRQADDFAWQTLALGERRTSAEGVLVSLDEPPGDEIPLASGYLHPSLLPVKALAAAMARAGRRPDAWQRPPVAGIDGLRAWFARSAGGQVDAADVIVTPGAQGALSAAFRALLPAGGVLLVESPTYPGALAVAASAGIRTVPVPVDGDGIRPGALARAFAATGARVVYCQPAFQNPTGVVLSAERRVQVLEAAAAAEAFVVEDDYGRWLAHERPAPPPLVAQDRAGRVVHLTSLTKPASPSLRVGALIARGPVAERLRAVRVVDDFFVSRPLQETALDLVTSPAWPRHLASLARALTARRSLLALALERYIPQFTIPALPRGGASLWVRMPGHIADDQLASRASRQGTVISPGRSFHPAEPPGSFIRLSFAAAARPEDLLEGVRRLALAVPAA
ncbi:MAG TPA: PLP-dependent aminotransferase family protein [Streptosporangiaceae bacterium]|nr:PLP-dependent aminotransferase family protein [Streptosporangiaceae bacterium]